MKALLDTSTLIAAMLPDHANRRRKKVKRCKRRGERVVSVVVVWGNVAVVDGEGASAKRGRTMVHCAGR